MGNKGVYHKIKYYFGTVTEGNPSKSSRQSGPHSLMSSSWLRNLLAKAATAPMARSREWPLPITLGDLLLEHHFFTESDRARSAQRGYSAGRVTRGTPQRVLGRNLVPLTVVELRRLLAYDPISTTTKASVAGECLL